MTEERKAIIDQMLRTDIPSQFDKEYVSPERQREIAVCQAPARIIKHKSDCSRVFKNYDATCPRCQELSSGATPREGWQKSYFELKARNEQVERAAIAEHFAPNGPHARGECGPVCTAFDW